MANARYVITCILVSLTMAGAVPASAQTPAKLPVVATFSILADFARNVGGDRIEVAALVGPDGDTHVYQPKPADAKELGAARLILVNGLGLEGWIDRLIKASGAKAPVIVATKGINPQKDARGRAHRAGPACVAIDRQCQDLCRQYPRRTDRRRPRRRSRLSRQCG